MDMISNLETDNCKLAAKALSQSELDTIMNKLLNDCKKMMRQSSELNATLRTFENISNH